MTEPKEHPGQPEEVLQPAHRPEDDGSSKYTVNATCGNCGKSDEYTVFKGHALREVKCNRCQVAGGLSA